MSKTVKGWGTVANVCIANKWSTNCFQNDACSIQMWLENVFECFRQKGINGTSRDRFYLVLWVSGPFSLHPISSKFDKWNLHGYFPLALPQSGTGPEHCTMRQCRSSNCSLVYILQWDTETKSVLDALFWFVCKNMTHISLSSKPGVWIHRFHANPERKRPWKSRKEEGWIVVSASKEAFCCTVNGSRSFVNAPETSHILKTETFFYKQPWPFCTILK